MSTLDFYNENAEKFIESTKNINIANIHKRFLSYVKNNGLILDFGCGSGRDSKVFMNLGYNVEAIDGSIEICKITSDILGIPVKCVNFYDFNEINKYDGIYACSSILHIPFADTPIILNKVYDALKCGGIFYMSSKIGDSEIMVNGKHYTNLTEKSARDLFAKTPFDVLEIWESDDTIPGRDVKWLNIIAKKNNSENIFL